MLESETSPLPVYVRLNTFKGDEKETVKRLSEEGVELERVDGITFTYKIKDARQAFAKTTCFKEGCVYLQDKASSFAAEAASPSGDMTVLDVCCAPGVLTVSLAQLMGNDGRILSLDYSSRRMVSWNRKITRAGVKIAQPVIADACSSLPFMGQADLAVLDPPCTGTGMFGRLPSSKWRLTQRSVDRMADIQWLMLNNCSEYVKPGGILIYTTLSITIEENEMLVERFLKWHPEFVLTDISPRIGLPGLRGLEKCQRLYPHVHRCNGLFIAKLVKN
jgi:16S rRNA (cytosine967-C5)-methyltransferase